MREQHYTLKNILESVFKEKNYLLTKRLIYNNAPLGGLDSKWIKFSFFILPFLMYAAIFNKFSFAELGIAQAIVFYIILLVFAMQIIVGVSYYNNKKVVKIASEAWKEYFPEIDFKMIISSGTTPYMEFKKYYAQALNDGLKDDDLTKRLHGDFIKMEEENSVLVEAIRKNQKKKESK